MTSGTIITIEADLGVKGVEKTDIFVYRDGTLIESHFDRTYEDIGRIAVKMRARHKDATVETCCTGLDCAGGFHRWSIEV